MSELSTFLFSRPSFYEGVGRLVDFAGTLSEYNYAANDQEADQIAFWADWTLVGNDMRSAWIDEVRARLNSEQSRDVVETR